MKTFFKKESLSLIVMLSTIGMWAYFYGEMPERIPIHFNFEGKADGFGNKDGVFTYLFPGLMAITYLVTFFIYRIDPKQKITSPYEKPLPKIRLVINLMFLFIEALVIYSIKNGEMEPRFMLVGILSIVFIGLGNLMHSIKHNYFIGFKTPWTLENEQVWIKTHRLVSKIWVTTGLINIVALWFVPNSVMIGLFVGMMITNVIWPFAYSWMEFKKIKTETN
jgi:uncharacterized membrane protein